MSQEPTTVEGANRRITEEVTSWPDVEAGFGKRGEYGFRVGGKEIGHLHGDTTAHLFFPRDLWRELYAEGRIEHHPVFPNREGPASRRITSEADVIDVIAMLRLRYEGVHAAYLARDAAA
jgi:hypothetical protein